MTQKKLNLPQAIKWMFQQYQQHNVQQSQDAYRIINIEKSMDENAKITIQVIGKNITFNATAKQLLTDDQMIDGFTKQDIRTLTYLACQTTATKPKYQLVAQEFCDHVKKIMFSYKEKETEKIFKKTAGEITCDSNMIDSLSQKEAHIIGYTAGMEHGQINMTTSDEDKTTQS